MFRACLGRRLGPRPALSNLCPFCVVLAGPGLRGHHVLHAPDGADAAARGQPRNARRREAGNVVPGREVRRVGCLRAPNLLAPPQRGDAARWDAEPGHAGAQGVVTLHPPRTALRCTCTLPVAPRNFQLRLSAEEAFNPEIKRSGWKPPQDSGLWAIADAVRGRIVGAMSPRVRASTGSMNIDGRCKLPLQSGRHTDDCVV